MASNNKYVIVLFYTIKFGNNTYGLQFFIVFIPTGTEWSIEFIKQCTYMNTYFKQKKQAAERIT